MPALERLAEQLKGGAALTRVIRAGRVTFAALSVPNYRRYYGGQAISLIGTWMQMTAQAWLVLSLTHSSTALGLIVALQTLPVLLLGPYGGVIADRVDKRRLMIVLQTAMGVQALILGVLTVTGEVQVWQIGVLAALLGLNNAFENPARQSFMLEMVGPEHLRNAVSLNSVLANTARVIGPAVAGILIATVGEGVCFLVNAASFVAVVASLVTLDLSALDPTAPDAARPRPAPRGPPLRPQHARAGGAAADDGRGRLPDLRVPGVAAGDGQPRAARRRHRLRVHDRRDGIRRRARRPARRRPREDRGPAAGDRRHRLRRGDGVRRRSRPSLAIELVALMFVGWASISFMSMGNSTLQLTAEPGMRGRVMSLWFVSFQGSTPIGGPIVGWLMAVAGARAGLGIGAVTCFVVALAGLAALRGLPRRRRARRARPEVSVGRSAYDLSLIRGDKDRSCDRWSRRACAADTGRMIKVENVTKRYGDKLAVDDLSFEVKPGIVTGFLGPERRRQVNHHASHPRAGRADRGVGQPSTDAAYRDLPRRCTRSERCSRPAPSTPGGRPTTTCSRSPRPTGSRARGSTR